MGAVILSKLVREGRTDTAPSEQHPNPCSAGWRGRGVAFQAAGPASTNALGQECACRVRERKGGHCGCAK